MSDFSNCTAAPACVGSGSSPDHTPAASGVSGGAHDLQQVLENELSTTPDNTHGEHCFTITHPFHPLCGQTFSLLSQRVAWGEERVFFLDPQTCEVRSLPLAWTNLALPDPFVIVATGRAVLRLSDVQHLSRMLRQQQTHSQEDR